MRSPTSPAFSGRRCRGRTTPRPAPCLSPPDGAPPPFMPAGGKWLFHEAGARLLRVACDAGAGPFAPVWLRLVFSVSLAAIAWAAWSGGRLLAGGTWVPAVAALAIATQPVLAKYSGAVTPDSLANAMRSRRHPDGSAHAGPRAVADAVARLARMDGTGRHPQGFDVVPPPRPRPSCWPSRCSDAARIDSGPATPWSLRVRLSWRSWRLGA